MFGSKKKKEQERDEEEKPFNWKKEVIEWVSTHLLYHSLCHLSGHKSRGEFSGTLRFHGNHYYDRRPYFRKSTGLPGKEYGTV